MQETPWTVKKIYHFWFWLTRLCTLSLQCSSCFCCHPVHVARASSGRPIVYCIMNMRKKIDQIIARKKLSRCQVETGRVIISTHHKTCHRVAKVTRTTSAHQVHEWFTRISTPIHTDPTTLFRPQRQGKVYRGSTRRGHMGLRILGIC